MIGPLVPVTNWSWNTAVLDEFTGPNRDEQSYLGHYHAASGPYPEAFAARECACLNQDPIVRVYSAAWHWQRGPLKRVLRVPEAWLVPDRQPKPGQHDAWVRRIEREALGVVVVR